MDDEIDRPIIGPFFNLVTDSQLPHRAEGIDAILTWEEVLHEAGTIG